MTYADDLARQVGCFPPLYTYLFTNPSFWYKMYYGPNVPYAYRLVGPHKWDGAREAIETATERIWAPLQTRKCGKKRYQDMSPMQVCTWWVPNISGIGTVCEL